MKLTTFFSLLMMGSLLLFACKGKKNPYAKTLSKESQETLTQFVKDQCTCIKENEEEIDEMTNAIKPFIEQMDKGEEIDPQELMGTMMGAMMGAEKYGKCAQQLEPDEAAMKKVEEELKAAHSDLSEEEFQEKQLEMLVYFMKDGCPEGAEFFETLMKFAQAMQKLSQP